LKEIRAFLLVSAVCFAMSVSGKPQSFNIPSTTLKEALLEFGQQAHLTMVLSLDVDICDLTVAGVVMTGEPIAVLDLLVSDFGLVYQQIADDAFVIEQAKMPTDNLPVGDTEMGNQKQTKSLLQRIGAAIALAALTFPAIAEEDPDDRLLEEILVTGSRQVTDLQTTSLAITNISSEQIEQSFARDLRGIADLVPNLIIQNVTPWHSAASVGIRGTGTGDIITTVDSPIGVVVDDFVLPHVQSQLFDPFDLERVEVLRGPQGTLFGKNTTGGVVVLRTKRPEHNVFHGKVQALGASFGRREYRAAVNIPLIDDKLSFRMMFSDQKSDGQFENDKISTTFGTAANPSTPLGLPVNGDGRDLNGRDALYAKFRVLWTPTDNYEALFTYEYMDDDSSSKSNVNETPANGTDSLGIPRSFLFNALGFPGISQTCANPGSESCVYSTGVSFRGDGIDMELGQRMDVDGLYLNQKITMGYGTFDVILGLREQEERLPGSFTGEAWGSLFDATRNLEREMRQAEVRFTSTLDGPIQFAVGGAYFENELEFRGISYLGFIEMLGVTGRNSLPGAGFATQDGEAIGLYGEVYYDLSDRLKLTAGVRYSKEEKEFTRGNNAFLTPAELGVWKESGGDHTVIDLLPADRYAFTYEGDDEWDDTTFRVVLDWEIDDNQFAYFSFNQGFRSGSFVESCASVATCSSPFDQESADSFEIGYKADLMDNTLRLNAALFYTEYEDVVRSQVVPIIDPQGNPGQETQFRNIAGAKNQGLELEVTWLATSQLQFGLTAAWLDAEYTDFLTNVDGGSGVANKPQCLNVDALGNDDASCLGIEPNFAPEWQLGVSARYEWFLANGYSLSARGFVHAQPKYEYSVFNSDFTQAQKRTLVDASITLADPDDRWQLVVYGKNITGEVYRVAGNSVGGLWNFSAYGPRERYGAELTVYF